MKNFNKIIYALLVILSFSIGSLQGQINCNDNINISFSPWDEVITLTPDMVLEGETFEDVIITPNTIDCSMEGQEVSVSIAAEINGVIETCEVSVFPEDKSPPVVILTENIVVALTTSGQNMIPKAKLFVESVDNGSYDGSCTPVEDLVFEPEFFEFDCSHIGDNIVTVTVTDLAGNTNQSFTTVRVEYKTLSDTDISCPASIMVDCSVDIWDENVILNTLGTPTAVDNMCPIMGFVDNYGFDSNGDGDLNDEFQYNGVTISETFNENCYYGPVLRIWSSPNTNVTCEQLIIVQQDTNPFDGTTDIDWPYSKDVFVAIEDNDGQCTEANNAISENGITLMPNDENPTSVVVRASCLDAFCDQPAWESSSCSLIGYSLEVDTFWFEEGVCAKIFHKYTVIDWCQYDPANPTTGLWEWTVIGEFSDSLAPKIETEEQSELSICGQNELSMSASAADPTQDDNGNDIDFACPGGQFKWEVNLDINSDFVIERQWSSFVPEDSPSNYWDDDNGDGIPDIAVGNSGQFDNASSPNIPAGFVYTINIPDVIPADNSASHRITWKVTDACGNVTSRISTFVVTEESQDTKSPTPFCLTLFNVTLTSQNPNSEPSIRIFAKDFNAGAFDNCTAVEDLRYTFSDIDPDLDPDYDPISKMSQMTLFESDFANSSDNTVEVNTYVWDLAGNRDFCTSVVYTSDVDPCETFTEDDINWPLANVDVYATGINPNNTFDELTPENLVDIYDFTESEVQPTFDICLDIVFKTYEDLVIVTDPTIKIIRTWTVLNWLTAQVYEYNQIIKVNPAEGSICDILPNSAPFGDCASGHTADDDVEWPDDLSIADYRIRPSELVSFSNVPVDDSKPIFFNNQNLYLTDYEDILLTLEQDFMILNRRWTVTRSDGQQSVWNYNQELTIDISNFGGLVTTNTFDDRPLPWVGITEFVSTDDTGAAIVAESETLAPTKQEGAQNGLNIRDILMIRDHILGISALNEYQIVASDYNNDENVTAIDIVEIQKVVLDITANTLIDWRFIDQTESVDFDVKPKANLIGIKPGDVDDSAVIFDEPVYSLNTEILIEDKLLNAGEIYEIEFTLPIAESIHGFEFHLNYNPELFEITGMNSLDFPNAIYNATLDGKLHILGYTDVEAIDWNNETIIRIFAKAKDNGLMNEAIQFDNDRSSFIIQDDLELMLVNFDYSNLIISDTDDLESLNETVSIHPNPSSDFIKINSDLLDLSSQLRFVLFNTSGQLILDIENQNQIWVGDLTQGNYIYQVYTNDKLFHGQLQIVR